MNGIRTMGAAASAVALFACGGEAGAPGLEGAGHTVADSAGVTVVTSVAPAWADGDRWRVGNVLVSVGDDGADLYQVSGVLRRADGSLVVADGGTSRVLFFGPDGTKRGEAGGQGDGPGEFRIIQNLGAAGDSVWVYDYSHRRLSFFDAEDRFTGTLTLEPPLNRAALVGRWPDGSFAVTELWGDVGDGPIASGLARAPVTYARYRADGALVDTLGRYPGREILLRPEGGRTVMGVAPFTRSASSALLEEGLVVGDQVGYELRVLDIQGGLRRLIRWRGPDLSVTESDVAAWKEAHIAAAASADRPSVRAYLADVPVPPTRPAYGEILTDPEGHVWVSAYAHSGEVPAGWDVFDARGVWLGAVAMPPGFRPLLVGDDWILGLTRDAVDVERLEARALIR